MIYYVFSGHYGDLVMETENEDEALEYCDTHEDAWCCAE